MNKGETATSYFGPEVTVITTTTVNDRILSDLGWEEELALMKQFQPDFHIPCDYPVYKDADPLLRRKHILMCLTGMVWMSNELAGTGVRIIPLLKGETPHERSLCYRTFAYLDVQYCVFYGAQYFTANIGFSQLREDLRTVISEAPDLRFMLIGLQAPRWLEELPPRIIAAAGQRWIDEVDLREVSWQESQERFASFDQEINEALSAGQMPIKAWADTRVTA